jgi:hypothetical protein
VLENRVPRRTFGLKETRSKRKTENFVAKNLMIFNLCRLLLERSRMRCEGNVAYMGKMTEADRRLVAIPEWKERLTGRIILRWILDKT